MDNLIRIPTAMQLCLDDVAWHNGADLRAIGQPSRSGIPRMHAPEDYKILNEIGKAMDMKIVCPLVIGEWDKENVLRGKVGYTYNPHGWDRKNEIDYKTAQKCFEEAENSEYIEYALHGVLHGRYDENGKQLSEREFFDFERLENGSVRPFCFPLEKLREKLDIFFEIYHNFGFTKKIRTFVSPCGVPTLPMEDFGEYAKEFVSRGIHYWTNGWMQLEEPDYLLNGMLILKENGGSSDYAEWDAYDYDPAELFDYSSNFAQQKRSVYGMHWTNFLRYNPENNMDYFKDWVKYFKRQSEIFGLMISRDIGFSANQLMYVSHAKLSFEEGKCIVDVSKVSKTDYPEKKNEFYISFKNGFLPLKCEGAKMEQYECKKNFRTYKFTHSDDIIKIEF